VLAEAMQLVPGDVSRGIGGAVVGVVLLIGIGFVGIKVSPMRSFDELRTLIFVATRIPVEWKRALALVAFAACEEIVFRGAVSAFLESRFGSARAPWIASALYVMTTIPSLHPAVISAAVVIGAVTAFLVSRFRRVTLAIVAHAAFAWLAVEFVLPALWQKLLVPVPMP
jgi:membrane protease YdiL (CAAX protease family)